MLIISITFSTSVRATTTVKDGQHKLHLLDKKIDQVKKNLLLNQRSQSSLLSDLKETEITIGKNANQYKIFRDALNNTQYDLHKLYKKQSDIQKTLDSQLEKLSSGTRAAYTLGNQNYLTRLLNFNDPTKFTRQLTYYHYFAKNEVTLIHDTQKTLANLKATQTDISQKKIEFSSLTKEKSQSLLQLNQQKLHQQHLLDTLNKTIKNNNSKLNQLVENRQSLEKLITQLQINQSMSHLSFVSLRGKLPWPTQGNITIAYGSHLNGVVIHAPQGESVKAIAPGRIVFANWLRGYGLLIIIDHGNRYMSLYGHNYSLDKSVGNLVTQGEKIATVGHTGGNTENGLYFEIRGNGLPEDPKKWCARHTKNLS